MLSNKRLAFLLAFLSACGAQQPHSDRIEATQGAETPIFAEAPVILISIDTLRADHLGCYGYSAETTPQLDRFAADGVVFGQTVAQAPSTLPSHASIFTSLLPIQHRAFFMRGGRLPEAALTLTEVLQQLGYRTGAFTGGGQMAPAFGLNQGFELYEVTPSEARTRETAKLTLEWIKEHRSEAFFAFLHSYEVHHPYTPDLSTLKRFNGDYSGPLPDVISKDLLSRINRHELTIDEHDLKHIIAAYDAEIASMDSALGWFFEELKTLGLYDRSIIIVTSDHGEEFGEHGYVGWHSHSLYDELLLVPLLVKLPQSHLAGRRTENQVRSVDIAPTVLDLVGAGIPDDFIGSNLFSNFGNINNSATQAAVSTQDTIVELHHSSLRTPEFKLYPNSLLRQGEAWGEGPLLQRWRARLDIRLHPFRLFDLDQDPAEKTVIEDSRLLEDFTSMLYALEMEIDAHQPMTATRDDETIERLKALGYLDEGPK